MIPDLDDTSQLLYDLAGLAQSKKVNTLFPTCGLSVCFVIMSSTYLLMLLFLCAADFTRFILGILGWTFVQCN